MTRRHWGCRVIQVDGQPVLVNARGPLTDEDEQAIREFRAFLATRPVQDPPPVEEARPARE